MIRPNDHCDDGEIAGHRPPGWVAFSGAFVRRDRGFDETRVLDAGRIVALKRSRPDLAADVNCKGAPVRLMACGGAPEAPPEALLAIELR
jgi:hypothetical protein